MKAEEKKTLYTFFRTASEYISGFKTDEEYPDFVDTVLPETALSDTALPETEGTDGLTIPLSDADSESGFESLEKVYAQIASCKACRLCERRHNTVAGEGPCEFSNFDNKIEVMVIGEGPGADEDAQGPLSVRPDSFWIRCLPPSNYTVPIIVISQML